jgi:hypothetical protein
MFIETSYRISKNEDNMELDNSLEESDDNDEEFPPLPSDIDILSYAHTPDPYDNRHHTIDFFYCASPPLPSPPPPLPPLASTSTMTRTYANARTFASIRNHDYLNQQAISFATQHKKKARAPIACLLQSVYVNLPMPPPPPPPPSPPKPINTSNEVTYATLLNTTSMAPSISSDLTINHVEYQQIQIQQEPDEINYHRIYENVKSRRPPPPPCYSQTNFSSQSPLFSVIVPETITNDLISNSSAHIYVNLDFHDDKPPTIPMRTSKTLQITVQTSPPPPAIPPRNDHKEETLWSSSSVPTSPIGKGQDEGETNTHETSSNASTVQVSLIIKKTTTN